MNEPSTPPLVPDHAKPPPSALAGLPPNPSWGELIEALLKRPLDLILALRANDCPSSILLRLSLAAICSATIFGLTLGSFAMGAQLWAAPVKIILGLGFSALICLPSLYIFMALSGTEMRFPAVARVLAATLALLGMLLLGFAPVLWVFAQSTNSFGFIGALAVSAWLVALLFGGGLLYKSLMPDAVSSKGPLNVWMIIFLLVTLQMSTTLRPLLGRAEGKPFISGEKIFFMQHWGETMGQELWSTRSEDRKREGPDE